MSTQTQTLGASQSSEREETKSAPSLTLVFECDRLRAASMRVSLEDVDELHIGRGQERAQEGHAERRWVIPDPWLSTEHLELKNSFGRWVLSDCGSRNGTFVASAKTRRHTLEDGDIIEAGRSFFIFREEGQETVDLESQSPSDWPLSLHPLFTRELSKIEKLAPHHLSILIEGESGVGKEVVAKAIHAWSERPGSMVPVNCGALPAGLIESELFGHRKGAFSGASEDHKGLIRQADRGTLFLDELADLPLECQAVLLRVLQDGQVRPVGATSSHAVDLKVVSATHIDVEARISEGRFRKDLFARLAGFRLVIPPLRDRRDDLGLLLAKLSSSFGSKSDSLSLALGRAFMRHDFPLNVRELRSILESASVLAQGERLELAHLAQDFAQDSKIEQAPMSSQDEQVRAELEKLLRQTKGNVSAIARRMEKDRKQIQRWLKRFGLDANLYR